MWAVSAISHPLLVPKQKELPSLVTRSFFQWFVFYLKIIIFSIEKAPFLDETFLFNGLTKPKDNSWWSWRELNGPGPFSIWVVVIHTSIRSSCFCAIRGYLAGSPLHQQHKNPMEKSIGF
jgi:hypothetical protein